jgi:arylsulfatase A-like enzyme
MLRRILLPALLASVPMFSSCAATEPVAPAPKKLSGTKPNIVFIFSDDHAAQALGAYGSRFGADVTPRLDTMAKEGVTFDNCDCGNPLCGPSRATVLTGRYSHSNRFFSNELSPTFDGTQVTLPKVMGKAGYQTAMIGKWHLGGKPIGFDHYEVLVGHGTYYSPELITAKGTVKNPGTYVTDLLTERALDWLKNGRDPKKPFVLMLHHKAPHRHWSPGPNELELFKGRVWPEPSNLRDDYAGRSPVPADARMRVGDHMYFAYDLSLPLDKKEFLAEYYDAELALMTPVQREKFLASFAAENAAFVKNPPKGDALLKWKYQRYMTEYNRCINGVDTSVGRVLDELKAAGLDDNTIVIYSSDQGFFLGEHGWYDKRFAYEESLRMPLLVRWPHRLAAGTRVPGIVQNTDFLPTFADLAGLPADPAMHGVSVLPLLEGAKPAVHDAAYTHFYEDTGEHHAGAYVSVRTANRKLINYYERGFVELYDLDKDPAEMRSVAADSAYAGDRKALEKRMAELAVQYGDTTAPWGTDKGGEVPEKSRVKPGSNAPKPALGLED